MNTTAVGTAFEEHVLRLIKSEIKTGGLQYREDWCHVYHQKAYYSSVRNSDIVFDVAVEIYPPGSESCSNLLLVECKNYTGAIPAGEVEEFYGKAAGIKGFNVKLAMATRSSLQAGALSTARSHGIAVLRCLDGDDHTWVLRRSPSSKWMEPSQDEAQRVLLGLTIEDYQSEFYDLYFQSPKRLTNSSDVFWEDLLFGVAPVFPKRGRGPRRRHRAVRGIRTAEIEAFAHDVHGRIEYVGGEVDLDCICAMETQRNDLAVFRHEEPYKDDPRSPLGRVLFEPLEIHLYETGTCNPHRVRFTLAHELAHLLLGHGEYLLEDRVSRDEPDGSPRSFVGDEDVRLMEIQANRLASCLLLPREPLIACVLEEAARRGLRDRGFGTLYRDHQLCNQATYYSVTGLIMERYDVSRRVVDIRLQQLGMLKVAL